MVINQDSDNYLYCGMDTRNLFEKANSYVRYISTLVKCKN